MANLCFALLITVSLIGNIVCPPVDPKKSDPNDVKSTMQDAENDYLGIEYNRYLQEVVQILESDPEFRKKLESSDPEDIRTGKIAKELEYVNHHVRSKLDELKRQELERLRHLAVEQYERSKGLNIQHETNHMKVPSHVDHKVPTFETEDLKKLIIQTTKDLEEADRKRREEFKEYELQKEFEHREKLKHLDEQKRKEEEAAWQEAQKKHQQHPKMHHPGSKQQLEEVWEDQDHMSPDSFNPKTFFAMHDLDGNGVWDQNEVKALFSKELDKVYDPNAPEDDMAERYEEMERMREHVFNETDVNRDYLISYDEFLEQTRRREFEQDPSWQTVDEQPVYSEQEYLEFERQRQMEIQRLVDQGLLPPHPGMIHPNALPPHPGQFAGHPMQMSPEEAAKYQQLHPAQMPPGQPQFVPLPANPPVQQVPAQQPVQQVPAQEPAIDQQQQKPAVKPK